MELKTSMILIPCLDQWAILRICLQPYMIEVSRNSEQNNSIKKMLTHIIQVYLAAAGLWAEVSIGASGSSPVAVLSRSRRRCRWRVRVNPPASHWGGAGSGTGGAGSSAAALGCGGPSVRNRPLAQCSRAGGLTILSVLPGTYGCGHR